MTVGMSAVSMVKNGRLDEALADAKAAASALAGVGAENVRTVLLSNSTPIRLVVSFEAESQAALGAVLDKYQVYESEVARSGRSSTREDGPVAGYLAETWIEV